jgi:polysaccharide deacetylase 2 family uncharacterized protein YibQ
MYKKLAMSKKAKKRPAKKGSGSHFDRWIVSGILIFLVLIGLVLWGPLRKFRPLEVKKQAQQASQQEPAPVAKPSLSKPAAPQPKKETPKHKPVPAIFGSSEPPKIVRIAIVIDDLGMDMKQARDILSLPAKITFAVMPGLAQSKNVAELAEQNNHEVLIHMPMEYRGKNGKPAPGILRSNMTPMEFLTTVSSDVESVPGAVGINNHEGSALTENKEAMKFLMAELKARNLMFLDSLTSSKSVAYATAKEFGLRSGKRDVFLDNDIDNPASIRKQLDELGEIARKNGRAIGIGHPHPVTITELRKWLADVGNQGFEIVPVSKVMQ